MDYSLLTDEELVALCKNNDGEAFSVLTERYIPVAGIYAARYSGAAIEKDDLTQEGMLGFIAAVYAFRKEHGISFSSFAGHCIKNRIVSSVRTISSKKRIPLELTVPIEERQDSPSNELSPEESLISRQETERISLLIEKELSEKERSVFLLYLQGLRYGQIAAECGCTAKSVDSTLQRVRKKLREKLS